MLVAQTVHGGPSSDGRDAFHNPVWPLTWHADVTRTAFLERMRDGLQWVALHCGMEAALAPRIANGTAVESSI